MNCFEYFANYEIIKVLQYALKRKVREVTVRYPELTENTGAEFSLLTLNTWNKKVCDYRLRIVMNKKEDNQVGYVIFEYVCYKDLNELVKYKSRYKFHIRSIIRDVGNELL